MRRIFAKFGNGVRPRAIDHRLNAENVPGPEGRVWLDTTIRGQKERGTGILNNDLYVGELVWNRCSYVKDPSTGKRLARPNPPDQWERQPVPELWIVPDELWQAVKHRQSSTAFAMGRDDDGNALNRAHRRRYLLSGLFKCGCCGAGFTIIAKDRYGCAGRRSKGICDNSRTISRQEVEERIPDRHSRAPAHSGSCRRVRPRLSAGDEPARLSELEQEKERLGRLASARRFPPIAVHPRFAEVYRKRVGDLGALLVDPELRDAAMEPIRSMIEEIDLKPDGDGGMAVLLRADLAWIPIPCTLAEGEGCRATAARALFDLTGSVRRSDSLLRRITFICQPVSI